MVGKSFIGMCHTRKSMSLVNERGSKSLLPRQRRRAGILLLAYIWSLTAILVAEVSLAQQVTKASNTTTKSLNVTMLASDDHAGTDADISEDGRFIVTSSLRGSESNPHLWLLDIANQRWRQITHEDGEQTEPQFSHDGSRIAYTSTEAGNKDIWLLDLASGKRVQLTNSPDDDEYANWSSDSKRLVYTGGQWKKRNHFIVEIGQSQVSAPKAVLSKAGHVGSCSFHADNERLLCHTYETGFGSVEVINADGVVERKVTTGPGWDYKPAGSSDGKTVVFSRISGPTSTIIIKDLDNDENDKVIESVYQDRWPVFFDNSRQVFFHRIKRVGTKVVLWDRQASKKTILVAGDERPLQAALDPTSRYLAYCSEEESGNHLVVKVLDRSTKKLKVLKTGGLNACYPRWSPDGKRIALLVFDADKWKLAVADPLADNDVDIIDSGAMLPNGFDGPIDWSPDSQTVVLRANTAAYESSLYLVKVDEEKVTSLTDGTWYDDAPAWSLDGESVSFMSTRGGNWTYGLFNISLRNRAINQITQPDYIRKNYPNIGLDSTVWTQYRACDGRPYIVETKSGEPSKTLTQFPGALWPSFSDNGKQILFTQVEDKIEFWAAEL